MRIVLFSIALACAMGGCDNARVYEKNHDFEERVWIVGQNPTFEFEVVSPDVKYNLYCNVRNSVGFPYSRLFINYALKDSSGREMSNKLVSAFLFDQHTGEPQGTSGLGDIYDQRFPLLTNYQFPAAGKYKVEFQQQMRKDTLEGVLAVGLRVEKVEEQ